MAAKCDFRLDPWSRFVFPEWFAGDFQRFLEGSGLARDARSAAASTHPSVKVDAAGEGWRVAAEDASFQSVAGATADGWLAIGRGPGFGGQIGASKCDWRVVTPGVQLQGRGAEEVRELRADFVGGQLTFGSAKRDWRVGTGTTQVQAMTEFLSERLTVQTRTPGFEGIWNASKCDWRFGGVDQRGRFEVGTQPRGLETTLTGPVVNSTVAAESGEWVLKATGAEDVGARLPDITAAVSSSKCDFRLRLTLDMPGGAAVFVGGLASSKCDFRFDAIELRKAGADFQPLVADDDLNG